MWFPILRVDLRDEAVDFEFVGYQRRDGDVNQAVEFELACLPASLQAVSNITMRYRRMHGFNKEDAFPVSKVGWASFQGAGLHRQANKCKPHQLQARPGVSVSASSS